MSRFSRSNVLLASATALSTALLTAPHPARAQSVEQLAAIEAQIKALQAELKQLRAEAARNAAATKQAQSDAAQAKAQLKAQSAAAAPSAAAPQAQVATIPAGAMAVTVPNYDPGKPNGTFSLGGVSVTMGGYAELTGYYRGSNESRGTSTSFTSIPYRQTQSGNVGEFNLTAQTTRISLLTRGKIDADSSMLGYFEADFNNGAGGANSTQSYSYTPRLRQAFGMYSYAPWNLNVTAGQFWSLATSYKSGLTPRNEFTLPTIDTAYIPGFAYLRVPALRISTGTDIDASTKANVAFEMDSPQTVFGGTAPTLAGTTIFTTAAGNGGLNPQTNYSASVAPDLIAKAALDTAFGHYEIYGLARWFEDRVSTVGKGQTNISAGAGFGGSLYIPVAGVFDIAGNFLVGSGIGRYGAAGNPDVTYKPNGALAPLREAMFTIGGIVHATPAVDIYSFYGVDTVQRSSGATGIGYGPYNTNNGGCTIELSSLPCNGNNRQEYDITVGATWKIMSGPWGSVQAGLQYEYAQRQLFPGVGGAPVAAENMIYANVRYAPFN